MPCGANQSLHLFFGQHNRKLLLDLRRLDLQEATFKYIIIVEEERGPGERDRAVLLSLVQQLGKVGFQLIFANLGWIPFDEL